MAQAFDPDRTRHRSRTHLPNLNPDLNPDLFCLPSFRGYLIRTLNVIVPDSPGLSTPSIAQRNTCDPAAFGVAANVAGRDDLADPAMYSSRAVRLSATTTSVIS